MEDFWQGMTIERIYKAGKDLILQGKWSLGSSEEKIEFPLAEEFILENYKPDYSQDHEFYSKVQHSVL